MDNSNHYNNTEKPTEEDLKELERFELNVPTPNDIREISSPHQIEKKKCHQKYPSQSGEKDWLCSQKRFYNKPSTTTPISTEVWNKRTKRTQGDIVYIYIYIYILPGLRYPRQRETVTSNKFSYSLIITW